MQKWEYLFAKFGFGTQGGILDRRNYDWLLDEINQPDTTKELKGRSRYDVFQELGTAGWELVQFTKESDSERCIAMFKRPKE